MPFSQPSSPREIPLQYPSSRWLFHKKMRWCIPVKNNLFPGFVPSTEEAQTDLSRFLVSLHLDSGHIILSHFSFYSASFPGPRCRLLQRTHGQGACAQQREWVSNSLLPWLCRAGLYPALPEQNRSSTITLELYSKCSSDWDAYIVYPWGVSIWGVKISHMVQNPSLSVVAEKTTNGNVNSVLTQS